MSYGIKSYPDGSKYVKVNKFEKEITFRLNDYENLWILNQLVDVYNNQGLVPTVTIPNLIDAQADKRFNENEPFSLKLICQFLNNMGAEFKIFHPHNSQITKVLLNDVKIIDNVYFIKEVISDIYCEQNNIKRDKGLFYHNKIENLILMSSDAGGFKPLMELCESINWKGETYSASKHRKYENNESKLTQILDRNDFGGKDILIIDDLSIYGGTFKGLSTLLKNKNVGNLYLATSHMTVKCLGKDPLTNYFDKVFTTNSKYEEYTYLDKDNKELPLGELTVKKLF